MLRISCLLQVTCKVYVGVLNLGEGDLHLKFVFVLFFSSCKSLKLADSKQAKCMHVFAIVLEIGFGVSYVPSNTLPLNQIPAPLLFFHP